MIILTLSSDQNEDILDLSKDEVFYLNIKSGKGHINTK